MTTLKLKQFVEVREISKSQGINFIPYPLAHLDLNNLKLSPRLIHSFKPGILVLKSGWIIDGRVMVTDDGAILGEGFNWSVNGIKHLFRNQNEKLKVKTSSKNLSITGFKDEQGRCDINREINNDELSNAIFLSGFDNLSHYMMEIAPKSLLFPNILNPNPNIKTIIASSLVPKKWIEYTIKTAESSANQNFGLKIKQFNPDKAVRFKNFVAITSTTFRGDEDIIKMSVHEAKSFSQQMCKNAASPSKNDPYILYLSRKNASHRRTVNQDNLIKIIKKVFPDLKFAIEEQIQKLSMEDQAKLIYNASMIIEEGGGSTAFTNNLLVSGMPYVFIFSSQRKAFAGLLYMAGLGKSAAWVLGEPVGKLTESPYIDNDIHVNETNFENLMIKMSLFIKKKIKMEIL